MLTLFSRSLMVLAMLFGLLFAVLIAVQTALGLPAWFAVAAAVVVVFLQYLIGPYVIQWIFHIQWPPEAGLTPRLERFIEDSCRRLRIRSPRLGVISDGNPNAFTFGHYPGNARLVVTRGLLQMLDEEEQEAVVAHELGHIVHWDFVVMTLAMVVPLVLYTVFRMAIEIKPSDDDDNKAWVAVLAVAAAAYVAYVLSQYIVLLLSRTREHYADEFSGTLTRNPRALATSLAKIAYGLARAPRKDEHKEGMLMAQAGKALGIFDHAKAGALALAAAGTSPTGVNPERIVDAMRWDLWNPWAGIYQLSSTHPLPARRLRALEVVGQKMGQVPAFDFPEQQPESYWDEFAVDLTVMALPYLGAAMGLAAAVWLALQDAPAWPAGAGAVLLGLGVGFLLKTLIAYRSGDAPERQVASLVGEVKVSAVRSVPARLRGKIIGRGVPGLFYSEDLVVQDDTGFILLDYRQPLGIFEFLFGLTRAAKLIGESVVASGWYRRQPHPYLELRELVLADGTTYRAYTYPAKLGTGAVFAILGGYIMLSSLSAFVR